MQTSEQDCVSLAGQMLASQDGPSFAWQPDRLRWALPDTTMSGLTGLVVTQAGLAPPGYKRTLVLDPFEPERAVLWTTKLPGKKGTIEPIVDLTVVKGEDAEAPKDFQLVEPDALPGVGSEPVFLAFRRRKATEDDEPITAVCIIADSDPVRENQCRRVLHCCWLGSRWHRRGNQAICSSLVQPTQPHPNGNLVDPTC